jgi:RNA polymerase sigma-70 factor (ECF subfamily)
MVASTDDTDLLLERVSQGDVAAREQLLNRHRERLRKMVAIRLDTRPNARLDPSDVVQEALGDAASRLGEYLRERPLPFYVWLRRLAWDHMIQAQRKHVRAARRSVTREQAWDPPLSQASTAALAERVVARSTASSPSGALIREERRQRVIQALEELPPRYREVLVLRYLEQLSNDEIAAVLGIKVGNVMTRHTRALAMLRNVLIDEQSEEER